MKIRNIRVPLNKGGFRGLSIRVLFFSFIIQKCYHDCETSQFLYQKEKSPLGTKKESFLTEQEREALERIVKEVQDFSKEKATTYAQGALLELCAGIFESEESLASNHDFFLYGAPKRK